MEKKSIIDKRNNFDFLRFFFASLVIVSHSYSLTGQIANEPMVFYTNRENFGTFAVNCFFCISGYLIFISLKRSKTIKSYVWKRLLRLFPGLFVMLLFTILIVPFLYRGNLNSVFNEVSYWTYLPRDLSLFFCKDRLMVFLRIIHFQRRSMLVYGR